MSHFLIHERKVQSKARSSSSAWLCQGISKREVGPEIICKLPYVHMLKFLGIAKLEFTCDFWSAALALYCKRFEACCHLMQGSLRERRLPKRKTRKFEPRGQLKNPSGLEEKHRTKSDGQMPRNRHRQLTMCVLLGCDQDSIQQCCSDIQCCWIENTSSCARFASSIDLRLHQPYPLLQGLSCLLLQHSK